ncbi:hypothetical protein CC79DRAFT_819115 [Sarocladium strictum]
MHSRDTNPACPLRRDHDRTRTMARVRNACISCRAYLYARKGLGSPHVEPGSPRAAYKIGEPSLSIKSSNITGSFHHSSVLFFLRSRSNHKPSTLEARQQMMRHEIRSLNHQSLLVSRALLLVLREKSDLSRNTSTPVCFLGQVPAPKTTSIVTLH